MAKDCCHPWYRPLKTSSKTTVYFSDINGDGLVDLVSDGKVYFNHIEFDASGNAIPTFTLGSADTPVPLFTTIAS